MDVAADIASDVRDGLDEGTGGVEVGSTDCTGATSLTMYARVQKLFGAGMATEQESGLAHIDAPPAAHSGEGLHEFRLVFDGGGTYDINVFSTDLGALPFTKGDEVEALVFVEPVFWVNILFVLWSPTGALLLEFYQFGESNCPRGSCLDDGRHPTVTMGDVVCQETDVCGTASHHELSIGWNDGGDDSVLAPGQVVTIERPSGRFQVVASSSVTFDWSTSDCTDNPGFSLGAAIMALP
jgi:hypothetical protein